MEAESNSPTPAQGVVEESPPSNEQMEKNNENDENAMHTASQAASTAAVAASRFSQAGDPASPTQPEPTAPQENHDQGPGDQLGADGADVAHKPTACLASDPRDIHLEPSLHGESAETAMTTASSPAAFSISPNRQGICSGSLTSPDFSPVQKEEAATYKADTKPKDERDVCHPEASSQEATITAIAAASYPATNQSDVVDETILALPATGLAQNKNDTPVVGDPIDIPNCDDDRREPPQDANPATVSTRRSRTPRAFTTSTAHRGSHAVKMPRRAGSRTLRAHRAPPKQRPQQPSPTNLGVPTDHVPAAAKGPRDQLFAKTLYPRRTTAIKWGDQVSARFQSERAQHANPDAHPAKTTTCDMDGVPHVVGGLVEVSLGRKDNLFAKQVPETSTDSNDTFKVERHPFTPFPPPDVGESNREFDMELEENRPISDPFDQDIIDRQIDGWSAQTDLFVRVMNAHQAEFDPVNELFLAQKAELTHLNNVRERAITAELARPKLMSEPARLRLIARATAAEKALLKEVEITQRELKEIIIRGRAKIARGLQRDLRAPSVIDEKRARELQRIEVEEKEAELAIEGATIGLRGGLNEQGHAAQSTILRYTRHVVEERLRVFDQTDDARVPATSTPAPPQSNIDTVISTVPEWFTILDARETIALYQTTPLDRYKELLQVMGNTSIAAREEKWADESRPSRHTWNQHFHQASPHWANELRRTRGGWWNCRSGADAPPAERYCALCHDQPAQKRQPPSAKERYQHILDEIDAAVEEAKERDQLRLKYQLQQERQDIDEYWQRREWTRSGGGLDITEVLHSRDVNELNYRPSVGRSQSWQEEGVVPRSQTLLDSAHVTGQASGPQAGPSQHSQSSQSSKHLGGTPPGDYFSLPVGCSPSPQGQNGAGFYESLLGRQPSTSPTSPAVSSQPLPARRLRGSPLFHELLAGRRPDNAGPSEGISPQTRQRLNSSQAHDILSSALVDKVTPGQVASPPPPPQASEPHLSVHLSRCSPQPAPDPAAPLQALHRHNSSQMHDLLHGRDAGSESSAQPGRPQLRSSLLRPGPQGQRKKPQKRVSWQL